MKTTLSGVRQAATREGRRQAERAPAGACRQPRRREMTVRQRDGAEAVMLPGIANRRDALKALRERCDVMQLEAFGSAARGDDFDRPASDADFVVVFRTASGLDRPA